MRKSTFELIFALCCVAHLLIFNIRRQTFFYKKKRKFNCCGKKKIDFGAIFAFFAQLQKSSKGQNPKSLNLYVQMA